VARALEDSASDTRAGNTTGARSPQSLPEPRWVADGVALAEVCRQASGFGRVAVDTEADSFHSYFHKLCLVQLTFGQHHVLVDPLAIGREGMAPVAALCADPGVVKVFHGADYDLRILHRDLGVRVRNLEDTQVAAQLLGEPQTGLAAMVRKVLGVELVKEHQRADFGRRPLPVELRRYAAADTAYLAPLAAALRGRLVEAGRLAWWQEECQLLEGVQWRSEPPTEAPFERIAGAGKLRGEARDRLAALAAWREGKAAEADVAPFRILRNETLLQLALDPPADRSALAARAGVGRGVARRFGAEILAVLTSPPPASERVPSARRQVDRERERRVAALRAVRDAVAAELGIGAGLLAPRAALEALVDGAVVDLAGVRRCLGREWRTAVLGPRLLPLLAHLHQTVSGEHAPAV